MVLLAALLVIPLGVVLVVVLPRHRWTAIAPGVVLMTAGWFGLGEDSRTPGDDLPDFGPTIVMGIGLGAVAVVLLALVVRALVYRLSPRR